MAKVKRENMVIKYILCVAMAVLVSSCSSTSYNVAPDQARPAFNGEVLVFEKSVPENIKYSVIGDFVSQSEWYGGAGETANAAVKEAAAKGANGMLIEAQGHRVTALSWASPYTEGKLLWIDNYDVAQGQQVKK
ncbi:hypothetical protein UWK_00414 [Desulfocapsa sulfexigens DSM 10523]|uniref:Lipoprotein n=1 Tax=Desulfocapsa sulfexigens (strain DSM 10523 / SB164P1) TaxID=1167006 RepID=M1NB31_DESSD|nr:hypothetical protein [Desulfocapsa sulfexigens]AGF76999.1 hypothetical protein UWK_00414 [Desulfocapsa sulfexigens DSM 10523]